MSKGHQGSEKGKESHHESHVAEVKGDHKKPETKKPSEAAGPTSTSRTKGREPAPGGCFSWGCKGHATRFNFCDEHYDHFKFGLIKKTGEPVSDYEKKIEHYAAHQSKQRTKKAV